MNSLEIPNLASSRYTYPLPIHEFPRVSIIFWKSDPKFPGNSESGELVIYTLPIHEFQWDGSRGLTTQPFMCFGSKNATKIVFFTHPQLFSGSYSTVLSIHSGKFDKIVSRLHWNRSRGPKSNKKLKNPIYNSRSTALGGLYYICAGPGWSGL